MRYAVAHGRRSRRGGAVAARVAAELRGAGHDVAAAIATTVEEAREVCAGHLADGLDALVVVGGDGGVSLAADLCSGTDTVVGIVPAGTGNDAARSLGIPRQATGALAALEIGRTGRVRTVDTLHLPGLDRHVLGTVPAALDARISDRANRWPRGLGGLSYTASALVEIALLHRQPPLSYRLTVDGAEEDLEALVVVPANLPYFGGGLPIAPEADPEDGLLDLVVVRPVTPREAVRVLRAVRAGRHTDHPAVSIRRAATVRIEGPADIVAQGDGEPLAPLPLTVAVDAASLRVIVPT